MGARRCVTRSNMENHWEVVEQQLVRACGAEVLKDDRRPHGEWLRRQCRTDRQEFESSVERSAV